METRPSPQTGVNLSAQAAYLKGIAENDLSVLKRIYSESLPQVSKYVRNNSGSIEDAKDIFQEGIMIIYRKVQKEELQLTTSFHVYLFSVCKKIWLRKLNRGKKGEVALEDGMDVVDDQEIEESWIKSRKWSLFNSKFKELADECRKVLTMLFNGSSGKEIAQSMGYSEDYAKRKKYRCKMGLAQLIKKDPEYKNLTTDGI